MRRADRLFQIVTALRRHGARDGSITAARLAELCEVSERTMYRDIRDLQTSGIPILGEAGVGYRLRPGYDLPPLMFTTEEIEALVLGARMVGRFADADLRRAAASVIDKAHTVLPEEKRRRLDDTRLFAPNFSTMEGTEHMRPLRQAIEQRHCVRISYRDKHDVASARTLLPLALYFWGTSWTLGAWCELREGYRTFRLDRMDSLMVTDRVFRDEPPHTLAAFVEIMRKRD